MDYISQANTNIAFRAKPIPLNVLNRTKSELLNNKVVNVDIYCHSSADEDTINSAKVFADWLTAKGKKVNICAPESEVKDLYINTKKYNLKHSNNIPDKSVVLDFNAEERLSDKYKDLFYKNKQENIIGYDHHTPTVSKLKGDFYVDDSAKSCCGILTRFFDGLGIKLPKEARKSLYCGMVSDYKKSGLLKLTSDNGIYKLTKTDKLLGDKNSLEVFDKLDSSLTKEEKNKIYKHLDPLSRLNHDEKLLRKRVFSQLQVSPNGKMAYVVIPPEDALWKKVGMDTPKTSEILKDLRVRVSENSQNVSMLSDEQKNKMKNVDTVVAFYRKGDEYRMSIHSRSNSAIKLIDYIKENLNPNIIAGGHADRAGGKIDSVNEKDTMKFVNDFVKASEIL